MSDVTRVPFYNVSLPQNVQFALNNARAIESNQKVLRLKTKKSADLCCAQLFKRNENIVCHTSSSAGILIEIHSIESSDTGG